jgi:hypothetical protein
MIAATCSLPKPHERQPQRAFFHESPRDSRAARGELVSYNLHFLTQIESENVGDKGSVHRGHAILRIFR